MFNGTVVMCWSGLYGTIFSAVAEVASAIVE